MRFYADTGLLLSLHLQETTSSAAAAAVQGISQAFDSRQRSLAQAAGLNVLP